MSSPTSTTADDAADLAHYKALCRDLADTGMEVAHALRDRIAITDHAPLPAQDELLPALAKGFDVVSASIRRTILVAQRLIEGRALPNPDRRAATKRVLREVEDEMVRARVDPEHAERLTHELHERIETPEFEDELDDRPVADIIKDIVHDLGLGCVLGNPPRWKRRTPAEIADLAARATSAVLRRHAIPELPASDPAPSDPAPSNPANDPCANAERLSRPERHHRQLATPNST